MRDRARGGKYVFVGGPPRSGTTLLQNVLDSHPNVAGTSEFLHLPDIVRARNRIQDSVQKDWIPDFCDRASVDAATGEYIESFLRHALGRLEARILSEKTPENILIFQELSELLPEARFIIVMRDPRGTIASMLEVGKRAKKKGISTQPWTRDLFSAIHYVKRCYECGTAFLKGNPDRCLAVSYERLTVSPEPVCRELVEFLALPWAEQMLRPGDVDHPGEKAITQNSGEIWYDRNSYRRNVDSSGLERWRMELTPMQQAIIAKSFQGFGPLADAAYDFRTDGIVRGARWMGDLMTSLSERRFGRRVARHVANASIVLDPQGSHETG